MNQKGYNPTQTNMKKTGGISYKEDTGSLNAFSIKDGNINSSNAATLKGKVSTIEDSVNELAGELGAHSGEIGNLENECSSVNELLKNKTKEVKETLWQELVKIESEIDRHINSQKAEGSRLDQQIKSLRKEKIDLAKELNELQMRLKDLEEQVGFDEYKQI